MNKEAQRWLHEADVNIGRVERVFTLTGSITSGLVTKGSSLLLNKGVTH